MKHSYKKYNIKIEENTVFIDGEKIFSKALCSFLKDCSECVVLALTLGFSKEKEVERLQAVNIAKAYNQDCLLNKQVEEFADSVCGEIKNKYGGDGQRFSCGFSDFSLHYQPTMLKLSKIGKYISVSSNMILIPKKSITAIVRIAGKNK